MADTHTGEAREGEEEEDTTLNSIKEYYGHHRAGRILRWIIYCPLFLFTVDPMSVYKASTYRRRNAARFRIYQTSLLQIELNNSDKRRARWRKLFTRLISYLCLKFSAILIVQVALHASRLSREQHYRTTLSDWQVMVDERGPLVEWAKLLGNPLIQLPGATIFIYGLIVSFLAYNSLYLVYYYTIEPFDSAILRNWLEPEREFKRIDLSILQTLQDFSLPLQRTCLCTTGGLRRKYAAVGVDCALRESQEIQTQVMGLLRLRRWHLRPHNYTLQWAKMIQRLAIAIATLVVLVVVILVFALVPPIFAYLFYNEATQRLEWSRITSYQWLTFTETWLSLVFLVPICVFIVILLVCLGSSQSILLQDVKNHLLVCLKELRQMNCGLGKPLDHLASLCTTLRPLIIVHHSLDELRNNVKFLTKLVSVNVVVSSLTCVCVLLAGYLDGDNLAKFRFVMIGFHWSWTNVILLGSALIYTKATKLETITWSMMAELRIRCSRDNLVLFEYQLAEFWSRLIMARCFSDSRMSLRPFGVTITYDRALKLNFLAISFASLLRSF